MALNFPNDPSEGDTYEGYVWNDTVGAWQSTQAGGGSIDASSNPPASPSSGDLWWDSDNGNLYIYYNDGNSSQWVSASDGQVTISNTVPTGYNGQLWWNSTEGQLYVYYNDGTSSQWVSVGGPKVTVQTTPPPGYQGQLWLDSTDGSMYVYYTDPGGVNSQWIGAVSRSGGILQVVSSTFTSTTTISAGSYTDTGLTVSITPRSTSSKIYIVADIAHSSTGTGRNKYLTLTRGTTELYVPDSPSSRVGAGYAQIAPQYGEAMLRVPLSFLDSPSTTSTVEYRVRARVSAASAGEAVLINRSTTDTDSNLFPRGVSVITAIEIAG